MLASAEKPEKQPDRPQSRDNPREERRRVVLEQPGLPVAKVGEEIITYHDVMVTVMEHPRFDDLKRCDQKAGRSDGLATPGQQ